MPPHPKSCMAPGCSNTCRNSTKIFIRINSSLAPKWCSAAGVNFYPKKEYYCCEDHMKLQDALENYTYWKMMDVYPRLKKNYVPKFHHSNNENYCIPHQVQADTLHKKDEDEVVQQVRQVCVALIMECGRPLEMLDDEPFRQLINMIVKKEGDRQQLTAAAIKSYIEIKEEVLSEDHDDSEQDMNEEEVDSDDGAVKEYEFPIPLDEIKSEVMSCTCQPRDDGNGHDSNCPLNCVPYWEYFEVSTNEAKCKECCKLITWTMMTDLKTHLVVFHPKISFKDDDDNFWKDHNASEILYQGQDNMATLQTEPEAKKKKLPPSTEPLFVALRDSEKICLDRFKSLDRFGLYVASLLKLLPEQKSIKYQEQIINRLLKEQPAAG